MAKILVFGDSMAYGKWDSEGGWATRLRKHVDAKYNLEQSQNFQVYNLGIPGEVTPRLAERFEKEMKDRILLSDTEKNNLVILAIGINDSCPNNWMTNKQTPEKQFKDSVNDMVDVAKEHSCKVMIVGLTPVNPSRSKNLKFTNKEVRRYDRFLTEVAKEQNVEKLELFDDLVKMNFEDLLVDAVHPNDKGHEMLVDRVIKYLEDNFLNNL